MMGLWTAFFISNFLDLFTAYYISIPKGLEGNPFLAVLPFFAAIIIKGILFPIAAYLVLRNVKEAKYVFLFLIILSSMGIFSNLWGVVM
jgi:hypothetical protein